MSEQILNIADNFWNIRGDFKIGGILNIGTHASIVRCENGKFVLLDAYTLTGKLKNQVDALTNKGADLEAIINLHPFHTVHVQKVHALYPNAKLYGTQRHLDKFPNLPWQSQRTETSEFAALFADDFEFSVPAGVDFISSNENLHFSSVLAYHKASKTIHVDDTLMYLKFPSIIGVLKKPEVAFHMTLPQTLAKRAGAAAEFRDWTTQLMTQWQDAENLCAAHSATFLGDKHASPAIAAKIALALKKVERTLQAHEHKFG
ncbi:hypothetical protein [Moritella sp. Urea-trap-13]|uniref:hypothetical protein n=1 Tax=Moritella sp. Urea-trap-13 TaxID=2058327 RepID=UPI000C343A9F|nr:hypothetical protein [Moritella sp. Urea-trap-13]PKH08091.1 hypothetical protein CXF93_05280 [Moritella sp. Urea-trap-13]